MWMIFSLYTKTLDVFFPKSCIICNQPGLSVCFRCISLTKKSIDSELPYVFSFYSYKDPFIKKILHSIKYFHRKDLLHPLTEVVADEIQARNYRGVLVPIPMPRIRKYIRGYNQAEYIATILSQKCSLPVEKVLTRSSSPVRQVITTSRAERLSNQKNSFKVLKNVSNLDIILVDDITTTGATIIEARKVLLASGARSVRAVTLAH